MTRSLARLLVLVVALVVIGTHRETPQSQEGGGYRSVAAQPDRNTLPAVASAASHEPMTLVVPLSTMPAEPAGNGVGVRSGGSASTPAPSPSSTPDASDVTWQGIASHMGAAPVPAWYLAIPKGPGYRVRLCGPVRCVDVTSTDAGPSLAMQRAGRVADLSVALFERVCDCPSSVGLINVSVTIERRAVLPTLPPTSTK